MSICKYAESLKQLWSALTLKLHHIFNRFFRHNIPQLFDILSHLLSSAKTSLEMNARSGIHHEQWNENPNSKCKTVNIDTILSLTFYATSHNRSRLLLTTTAFTLAKRLSQIAVTGRSDLGRFSRNMSRIHLLSLSTWSNSKSVWHCIPIIFF